MAYRNKHAQEDEEEPVATTMSKGLSLDDLMGSDEEDDDDEELVPLPPVSPPPDWPQPPPLHHHHHHHTTASPSPKKNKIFPRSRGSVVQFAEGTYFKDEPQPQQRRRRALLTTIRTSPSWPPLRQRSQSFMQVTTQHLAIQSSAL